MNHWGKNGRNHEYQDSNDSASTPDTVTQFFEYLFFVVKLVKYRHRIIRPFDSSWVTLKHVCNEIYSVSFIFSIKLV